MPGAAPFQQRFQHIPEQQRQERDVRDADGKHKCFDAEKADDSSRQPETKQQQEVASPSGLRVRPFGNG